MSNASFHSEPIFFCPTAQILTHSGLAPHFRQPKISRGRPRLHAAAPLETILRLLSEPGDTGGSTTRRDIPIKYFTLSWYAAIVSYSRASGNAAENSVTEVMIMYVTCHLPYFYSFQNRLMWKPSALCPVFCPR